MFYFHPYLGKIPILTNIFQMGWNHQPGFAWLLFGMGIQGISGGCSNFLFFPKILGGGVKGFFMFTPDNLGRLYIYILKRKWHMYFSIELLQPTTSWLFQLVSRCGKKSAGFREFLQGPEKSGTRFPRSFRYHSHTARDASPGGKCSLWEGGADCCF